MYLFFYYSVVQYDLIPVAYCFASDENNAKKSYEYQHFKFKDNMRI